MSARSGLLILSLAGGALLGGPWLLLLLQCYPSV